MNDVDNNVIALMVLQKENKQLKEKLEQIENIITETENQHYELQGKKVVMNSLAYDKIKEVIENG